jgi:hypothetical protein
MSKNPKYKTFFLKILGSARDWLIWPQITQSFKFKTLENLSETPCKSSCLSLDNLNWIFLKTIPMLYFHFQAKEITKV